MELLPIWVLGFILNLFLLYAVFQIYFQSPVVQIHQAHSGKVSSGVRRVVFFVADGLRADSFFSNPDIHPRLTTLIRSGSSVWGISDTRVPTESRPGHIALFAGLYEDPSAIFTGWKENLVEFDSVFNRSSYSVALGSPDIVLMFAKGAGKEKIHAEAYSSDWQDFLTSNSSILDTWVLDRFKSLLRLKKLPTHDKMIIFLHMLGIDNTGHATKPQSKEYIDNIGLVDGIISETERLVKDYFGDDLTTFIFTSDHGMTDWGCMDHHYQYLHYNKRKPYGPCTLERIRRRRSHGDGSASETETPFVIWGKAVRGEQKTQLRIKQADFAALMSGLLNVPFPTNSVGRFPSAVAVDQSFAYDALSANFKQIHMMMNVKKYLATSGMLPFTPFEDEDEIHKLFLTSFKLVHSLNYTTAINTLDEAITLSLAGIKYYERYDQSRMLVFTVYSYLVWMALICFTVLHLEMEGKIKNFHGVHHLLDIFISVLVIKGVLGWSMWRVPYSLAPLYLSRLLYSALRMRKNPKKGSGIDNKVLLGLGLSSIVGTEILVLTFYKREILTLGLFLNGLWCMKGNSLSTWKRILWLGSVALLGIFPSIPVIGRMQNTLFMTLGPLTCVTLSILSLRQYSTGFDGPKRRDKVLVCLQTGLLLSVSVLIHFPDSSLTRLASWSSVLLSLPAPVLISASSFVSLRILSVFLAISTPFCFLSLAYESLFLPALYLTLFILVKLEATDENDSWTQFWSLQLGRRDAAESKESDLLNAFRRAWLHLFFVYFSFFGIGNIGSISSFDPSAVRCFLSIFNPFVMMILLLVKIIGPFLLVSCFFRLLMLSRIEVERNFLIVLFLCQGMGLHTFFNVTNQGSWLEIGTSISHYVIVQVTTLFLSLLYFGANFLMTGSFSFTAESIPVFSQKYPYKKS